MCDFGLRLKSLRASYGFTQKQLAKKLNVSEVTVSRWESNYRLPEFISLLNLSILFDVTLDYIAGIDKKTAISTNCLSEDQVKLLKMIVCECQSRI